MPISINPYADQLIFPPGTPASVMNMVLQMRARNDALKAQQNAQPEWWETGINGLMAGATNQLLFPWLKNEFVNAPYEKEMGAFKTDEAIRLNQAQNESMSGALQQRAQDAYDLQQTQDTGFGGAINAATQAYVPTPASVSDTGVTPPYNSYEDPWSTSPGPTYEPPTQMQGDVAPVERDRIITATPQTTPTTADMLRRVSGESPLNAGILARAFEKNANLSNLLDPTVQAKRQADINKTEATTADLASKAAARDTSLPLVMQNLVSKGVLTQAQAETLNATRDLTYGKGEQQNTVNHLLGRMSDEEATSFLGKGPKGGGQQQQLPRNVMARLMVIQGKDPGGDPISQLQQAIKEQDAVSPLNQIMVSKETVPVGLARSELPKVETALHDINTFNSNLDLAEKAAKYLNQNGLLAENPSELAKLKAKFNRQLNPEVWDTPGVQEALGALAQLRNAVAVGYDRSIGDKGARIGAAYNLPEDPTLLSFGELTGQFNAMRKGSASDFQYLNDLKTRLYEGIGGNAPPPGTKGYTPPSGFRKVQ